MEVLAHLRLASMMLIFLAMTNGKPAKHEREMWLVQDHGLDSLHLNNGAAALAGDKVL